jgi:putative ATPase
MEAAYCGTTAIERLRDMDLFDYSREKNQKTQSPLAARMRPETLDEFVGQSRIAGDGKLLNRAIKADKLTSVIFYGPPGTGKTTLAFIIAKSTKSEFVRLNATVSGIKDIRDVISEARALIGMTGRRTILFIDEIHRFNKSQQDALLPYVEDGTVILVGATTENPYFEVNKALVSRSIILMLEPLSIGDIKKLLKRAAADNDRGVARNVVLTDEALEFFADMANGDARNAYNALELAALTTEPGPDGAVVVDLGAARECIQKRPILYDKSGDNHYDVISAFIKSMRGSDPDASLYYLARMIYGGEDPMFIARRIVICAAEDVGNADPRALQVAVAAADATAMIGLPEAQIPLAQAATYVACAPKSNASVAGIGRALRDVENKTVSGVPPHLRDASYPGASRLKHGEGYLYAHDFPGNYVKQQYLPDELIGSVYYAPSDNGEERIIKQRLGALRNDP